MKREYTSLETMIRTRREQCDVTQSDLATHLGFTTPQYVSNCERGRCKYSLKHFRKISQKLGIPMREMVDHRMRDVRRYTLRQVRLS